MSADKTIPTILLVGFLVAAIPTGLYFRKLPPQVLPATEMELSKFASQPVAMSSPRPQVIFSGLACPVTPAQQQKPDTTNNGKNPIAIPVANAPPKTVQKSLPRSLASLPVVSMISYDGSTRTAIVDNHVVTEGSKLNGGVIVKIEETRVLMRKAGRDVWLTTD